MKRTPWFPKWVLPVREGWYEARFAYPQGGHTDVEHLYWDGRVWTDSGEWSSEGYPFIFGVFRDDQWRGLAAAPKSF